MIVKQSAIPFDLFTDTPDYTPYDYAPRSWPRKCGADTSASEIELGKGWDVSRVDLDPGLDAQVHRYMRGEALTTVPKEMSRPARRRGRPPPRDDDDDD